MIKKTITYTDYDGNTRKEDFYFNLSKAELAEMNYGATGGMQKVLERMTQEQDMRRLLELVKEIVLKSYGQKSMDGKRFIKSEQLREEFSQTEAYSNLYVELLEDGDAAAAFFKGILPSDITGDPRFEQALIEAQSDLA